MPVHTHPNITQKRTTLANESRKMPESDARTSTRGRPSSASGTSSYLTMRPVASFTGRAPTRLRRMATDSPRVLMASSPQSITATVSGYTPSLAARCCSRILRAASCPRCQAAGEGRRYGSSAWMLRPVGSTPVPSRSRSPPTPGSTYSPFSALRMDAVSSVLRSSSRLISSASSSRPRVVSRCARAASAAARAVFRPSSCSGPKTTDTSCWMSWAASWSPNARRILRPVIGVCCCGGGGGD